MSSSKNTNKLLEWTSRAVKDRKDIWDYIALKEFSPFNATLVEARILQVADRLSRFPMSGKPFFNELRLAFIAKPNIRLFTGSCPIVCEFYALRTKRKNRQLDNYN